MKTMDTSTGNNAVAGTVGGTVLVILLHIGSEELVKTIVLAAVGAAVSFSVSMVLKWMIRKMCSKK